MGLLLEELWIRGDLLGLVLLKNVIFVRKKIKVGQNKMEWVLCQGSGDFN